MVNLKSKALSYLAKREHSYRELFIKLKIYCDNELQITSVLNELVESDYLSDIRYINSYLRSYSSKHGLQKIRHDLIQKTGNAQLVNDILNTLTKCNEFSEYDNAYRLWYKKFGSKSADNNIELKQKDIARQVRYLQSKGFSLSIIRQIVIDKV